jgi:predicted transcriptional regulator
MGGETKTEQIADALIALGIRDFKEVASLVEDPTQRARIETIAELDPFEPASSTDVERAEQMLVELGVIERGHANTVEAGEPVR